MLVVDERFAIPLTELRFTFARSGGPGGQNVNKVSTKVVLRWDVLDSPSVPDDVRDRFVAKYRRRMTGTGEVVVHSQRFRDRGRNVADCLSKLREMLLTVASPPRLRRPSRPPRAARERRLAEKKERGQRKRQRRRPTADE